VKHFVKLRTSKTYREENKSVIVVGKRMISELSAKLPIKNLVLAGAVTTNLRGSENATRVSNKILQKMSGVISPDGYIAEFALPPFKPLTSLNAIAIFDGLQDPGNIGTLIRSALAFGFDGIYFIEGSCDPYNEKVVSASKGAIFHIQIGKGSWEDFFEKVQPLSSYTLYRADLEGVDIHKAKIDKPFALILGNEGGGISAIAKASSKALTIPISLNCESLNVAVAGSICMYMMRGL